MAASESRRVRELYEFGPFRVNAGRGTLLRDGTPVALTPKAYSTAWNVVITSGSAMAIPLYQRAIQIDPQFAMAYGRLGRMYGDLGESALSAENSRKAWELRDRVSDRERFFLSAI